MKRTGGKGAARLRKKEEGAPMKRTGGKGAARLRTSEEESI